MKKIFISIAISYLLSCSFSALAQVGIGTTTPNSKAVLELTSPNNNQGFLTPRLTTAQRNAISGLTASDNGLLVYDTEEQRFYYWHSPQWETLRNGANSEIQDLTLTGAVLTITNNPSATPINLSAFTGTNTDDQSLSYNATSGLLSLTTLGTPSTVTITSPDNTITSAKIVDGTIATADLENTSVTDQKISNVGPGKITQSGATPGQVLKWNGTAWAPAADAGLLSYTETDPSVKAINGIVKSNGTTISAAIATDFPTLNQNTTGTAGSAAILTTGRSFSLSGDATGTTATAFNGSANATIPVTLANSGVTAGTYNTVTVDAKGRVTGGTNTTPTGTAGGDLTGSYPNPTVLTNAITSAKIADGTIVAADLNSMSAVSGQVLKYNGTAWAPAADAGLASFTETDPLVKAINGIVKSNGTTISAATATDFPTLNQNTTGSAGNAATLTTARTIGMTGDVTWTSAAFNGSSNVTGTSTIGTGAVTSAKIADGTIVAADLNSMSASSGQVLKYNGTAWAPAADAGLASFTETDPLVKAINGIVKSNGTTISAATATDFPTLNQNTTGSAGNAAILTTARTIGMTGDVTWTSAAFNGSSNVTGTSTIGTGAVTSAKIADGTIVAADLNSMSASSGQVLKYNGTAWAPAMDNGGASPGLNDVLTAGNSAGGQEAHEFKAVSVNWDVKNNPYGALSVDGSQFVGFTEVSLVSSYTVKSTDYLIIADGDIGTKPINVTLPSAAANKGRILIVRSISTSVGTSIEVRAADGIDGTTTYPEQLYYAQGNVYSITVVSTGKTWLTINRAVAAAGK